CLGTGVKLPYVPELDPRKRGDEDASTEAIGAMAERLADQMAAQRVDAGRTTGEDVDEAAVDGETPCPACDGRRLNSTSLAVKLLDLSIAELTAMPVADCARWLAQVGFAGREQEIARDVLAEIRSRLAFLQDVGLGYLTLDRAAPTLSGGEAQRIRLAAQLGSNL